MIAISEGTKPAKTTPGEVLLKAGHAAEAIEFLSRESATSDYRWQSNMGAAYRILGQLGLAKDHCKSALEINQCAEKAWFNLALVMQEYGEFEKAREAITCAYNLLPIHKDIAFNYAMMNMRFGDWPKYQDAWDFGREEVTWVPFNGIRKWYGEDIRGKRILVIREGGYGDFFWLYRYFRLLKMLDCNVTYISWKSQAEFCKKFCPWIDCVVSPGDFIDERYYDFQIPTWSLISLHDEILGMDEPYIQFPNVPVQKIWGVAWEAAETVMIRKVRSLPLDLLKGLRYLPDFKPILWYALSISEDDTEDWMDLPTKGFENLPEKIAGLEIVITVDTYAAHLAGAMGKETILLLPKGSEFKWGTPENSFVKLWYPSITEVRCQNPMDWSDAIQETVKLLEAKIGR